MGVSVLKPQVIGATLPAFWKRVGMLGFAFLFIKGLLWLTAPFFFYFLA